MNFKNRLLVMTITVNVIAICIYLIVKMNAYNTLSRIKEENTRNLLGNENIFSFNHTVKVLLHVKNPKFFAGTHFFCRKSTFPTFAVHFSGCKSVLRNSGMDFPDGKACSGISERSFSKRKARSRIRECAFLSIKVLSAFWECAFPASFWCSAKVEQTFQREKHAPPFYSSVSMLIFLPLENIGIMNKKNGNYRSFLNCAYAPNFSWLTLKFKLNPRTTALKIQPRCGCFGIRLY